MTARVYFKLQQFAPFEFCVDGVTYSFSEVRRLAQRDHHMANLSESVVETRDGKKVWLTVVGDSDEPSASGGIDQGWYTAIQLTDEEAAIATKAIKTFTGS